MVHLLLRHQHETEQPQLDSVLLATLQDLVREATQMLDDASLGPLMDDDVDEEP